MDGVWTQWKRWTIRPLETLRITGRGGIHCRIVFDASFEEGRQGASYCLPFDVTTSPSDPLPTSVGTPDRFEIHDSQIDLKRDDTIAPLDENPPPVTPARLERGAAGRALLASGVTPVGQCHRPARRSSAHKEGNGWPARSLRRA